jgi:Leucine-rich repeat (LRR) protein
MRKEIGKWAAESVKQGEGIMDNQYIKYLNQFGGSAIRQLAKEYSGSFNTNKYLKWIIANTGDVDVREFIDEEAKQVDFTGFNLKRLPDLSSFENIMKIVATNSGLTVFPDGNELPPNVDNVILSKNQIPELTFSNFDKLKKLKVILAMDNPYTKIDVDNLINFIKSSEEIFTIGLSPADVKKISNYDEYFEKLSNLRKELGPFEFPVIEPFGFDFND